MVCLDGETFNKSFQIWFDLGNGGGGGGRGVGRLRDIVTIQMRSLLSRTFNLKICKSIGRKIPY